MMCDYASFGTPRFHACIIQECCHSCERKHDELITINLEPLDLAFS